MQTSALEQGPNPNQVTLLPPPTEEERAAAAERSTVGAAVAGALRGRHYKQGPDSAQPMLLPPSVDDYVAEDNPVRAIKAYVETLDLADLGFKNATGGVTAGQPAFAPADLLGLYLYGYLNRVRSSRRLEAECQRNLEVIWLLNGLRPGYHSIADFRKDNAAALKAVNRDFVQLCRELGLFGGKLIGIDGSFFHGDASHASVKTKKQLQAELAAIERDIARYEQELNTNDAAEADLPDDATTSAECLDTLKARAQRKTEQLEQLGKDGETQLSRTDPDARRLRKNGKKVTGYNVQTAVDDQHKLIITYEVTNAGNDLGQLVPMAEQAKQTLEVDELEVVADAGYFTEADIAACEERGIVPYVPVPDKHRATRTEGRLPGSSFHYNAAQDIYICPAGQLLPPEGKPTVKNGVLRQRYRSDAERCQGCPLRAVCLPQKTPSRQIYRSEHAKAIERHRQRMDAARDKMRQRAGLCEHPFGTMKRWLGWDHFLVRGFEKVRGEMGLLVTCYNLKRILSIFGVAQFMAICAARRQCREAAGRNEGLFRQFAARSRRLSAPLRALRYLRLVFGAPERAVLGRRLELARAL